MERDRELVRWISKLGAVTVGHVGERFGVGRSVAYDLVARAVNLGLLERFAYLRAEPTLITATAEGNRYAQLGLAPATIRPSQVRHWIATADVALWAERTWGTEALVSERELRLLEAIEDRPIASAVLGELPTGAPRLHRPDLVVRDGAKRPIAIEVELTPKAPARLIGIMRGWRKARHVERVVYLTPRGIPRRAVERAANRAYVEDRIEIRNLPTRR